MSVFNCIRLPLIFKFFVKSKIWIPNIVEWILIKEWAGKSNYAVSVRNIFSSDGLEDFISWLEDFPEDYNTNSEKLYTWKTQQKDGSSTNSHN